MNLNEEDQQIVEQFIDLQLEIADKKSALDAIKPDVVAIMEDYRLDKYDDANGTISYSKPTVRTSIDSARLKKDLPEVAAEYSKVSPIAAGVRFKAVK